MSATNLIDLPPEALAIVAGMISSSRDLKNVALASQACYAAFLPHLYRTLRVDAKLLNSPGIWSENRGLQHVRHLIFDRICGNLRAKVVKLVKTLPENRLLSTRYYPSRCMHGHILDAGANEPLLKTNHTLRNLRLRHDMGSLEEPFSVNTSRFTNLRDLELILAMDRTMPDNIPLARRFIKQHSNLESLFIAVEKRTWKESPSEDGETESDSDMEEPEDDGDETNTNQLVPVHSHQAAPREFREPLQDTKGKFGYIYTALLKPGKHHGGLRKLKHLALDNVCLTFATKTYMKAIDFCQLETLLLRKCEGAEKVLKSLVDMCAQKSPSLTTFVYTTEQITNVSVLSRFLASFTGLETLRLISMRTPRLPAVNCITRHCATLKKLVVDMGDVDGEQVLQFSSKSLRALVSSCSLLEEIGIAMPVDLCDPGDHYAIIVFLENLKYLRILNIAMWLDTSHGNAFTVGQFSLIAKDVASRLFIDPLVDSQLPSIVGISIGSRTIPFLVEEDDHLCHYACDCCGGDGNLTFAEPKYFVKGTTIDLFGRSTLTAVPCGGLQLGNYGIESDVFEIETCILEEDEHEH